MSIELIILTTLMFFFMCINSSDENSNDSKSISDVRTPEETESKITVLNENNGEIHFYLLKNGIYNLIDNLSLYIFENNEFVSKKDESADRAYLLRDDVFLTTREGIDLYEIRDNEIIDLTENKKITIDKNTDGQSGVIKSWSVSSGNYNLKIDGIYSNIYAYLVILAANMG